MLGMFEAVSCLPVPAGPQLLDGGEVNIDTDQLSTRRHPQLVGKTQQGPVADLSMVGLELQFLRDSSIIYQFTLMAD